MEQSKKQICVLFCAVICSLCLAAGGAVAEGEQGAVNGYPATFDGAGEIDCFNGRYISIGDLGLNLSPGATFNTPYSLNCSRAWFRAGKYVGYLLDSKGEVQSLWLISRDKK